MEHLLELFDQLTNYLSQLSKLAQQKIDVVRKDDLIGLDEVLKQEQALALTIRGLEQKQSDLLKQLHLQNIPLSDLHRHCDSALQLRVKKTVETLRSQYQIYHTAAEVARNTLECNLHEIEKVLSDAGAKSASGPGYGQMEVNPPSAMKTDFRA